MLGSPPRSPRKKSPTKVVKTSVEPLRIDNDSLEDSKKYEKVSLIIEEIPPLQERLKFDAFKDVEFWMNKGYEWSYLNQLNAAVDFYKHGLKVDSLNPVVYYNIGAVFSQRSEWK